MKIYLVGVGPGDPEYITEKVRKIIINSDIIIGYKYTIEIVKELIDKKDVRYITLKTQDEIYSKTLEEIKDTNKICTILFTGDVNFSESEMVDKIRKLFKEENIIIEPGISSIQIAAARSKIALDKSVIITFHITGCIEEEKQRLLNALKAKENIILLPRPWDFMPNDIASFIEKNGIDGKLYDVEIYERLTLKDEMVTRCKLDSIPFKEYSDLCVMVIKYGGYGGSLYNYAS